MTWYEGDEGASEGRDWAKNSVRVAPTRGRHSCANAEAKPAPRRAFLSSLLNSSSREPNTRDRDSGFVPEGIAKVEILLTRWPTLSATLSRPESRDKGRAPIVGVASDALRKIKFTRSTKRTRSLSLTPSISLHLSLCVSAMFYGDVRTCHTRASRFLFHLHGYILTVCAGAQNVR